MQRLYLDLETYNGTDDLIRCGSYRYAETAEITLISWAFDDGPVSVCDLTTPWSKLPDELSHALCCPGTVIVAHNGGQFDRLIQGTPVGRWYDTMVQALSHSLPGSLATLCDIFRLPQDQAKMKEGRQLVLFFCKPHKGVRHTRESHPEKWAQFIEYAGRDIVAMRELHKRMPTWNYCHPLMADGQNPVGVREWEAWVRDQQINDAGLRIDTDLAEAAILAVNAEKTRLKAESVALTDGQLESTSKRNVMLGYLLAEYGVDLPDLTASTLERRVTDESLPLPLRQLLANRLQMSTASVAKYQTLMRSINRDGYLRGYIQFNGAGRTGRMSARRFQPHNMARPSISAAEADLLIDAVKAGLDLELVCDNTMQALSDLLRGCIIAPEGQKIVAADYSNIEGRLVAWLCGEEWKMQAFRDFDAGTGHDLYKLAYAKSFGVPPESIDKQQRQVGKVQELAFGYRGGVSAAVTFALVYGIDLSEMAELALANGDPRLIREAEDFYRWALGKKMPLALSLGRDTFAGIDVVKRAWREAHPETAQSWLDIETLVKRAITTGHPQQWGHVRFEKKGNWLRAVLPSGRALCYASPQVDDKGKISFMGMNQYSRKWQRQQTHGGVLLENMAQAIARDVMIEAMPRVAEMGYHTRLTVHDELVTYAHDLPQYSVEELSYAMTINPPWAEGLPLAAEGFEHYRYRKE